MMACCKNPDIKPRTWNGVTEDFCHNCGLYQRSPIWADEWHEAMLWQEASDAAVLLFVRAMWLVIGAMTYGFVVRLAT